MSPHEPIVALHRYYIWANRMREHFDRAFQGARGNPRDSAFFADDIGLFMSYWYGALYVVVEGYRELHLSNSTIDALLESSNVALLKRYRNGAFHFQVNYFDPRFLDFVQAKDAVPWVRELNSQLGRFLLQEIRNVGPQTDPSRKK